MKSPNWNFKIIKKKYVYVKTKTCKKDTKKMEHSDIDKSYENEIENGKRNYAKKKLYYEDNCREKSVCAHAHACAHVHVCKRCENEKKKKRQSKKTGNR
jgi:hypothetical protein